MKLYHGTTIEFENPDLSKSRKNTDFGAGFYLTDKESMADDWKKGLPNKHINVYELTLSKISSCNLHIKKYEKANIEWAKFVYNNRRNKIRSNKYDLIIGPVADNGLEAYFREIEAKRITWEDLIQKIEFRKFKALQYCFVKPNAIKLLNYVSRK